MNIPSLRLYSQHIAGEKFATPEAVVGWMGAMQAQDYGQSVWAVGTRMQSSTLTAVEQALEDGRIIRTWTQRGTIHFALPHDAKWMLQLSAARMIAADARRMGQLDLTIDIMERCKSLLCDALRGGKRLTRPEMLSVLEQSGISPEGQRGYHILWYVAQSGLIYIGAMQGKQQTFGLLDELTPDAKPLTRPEALVELARRYFISHGPATIHDFAWWAGLTVTEARQGLDGAKSALISETLDGKTYWFSGTFSDTAPDTNTYLLPGFDEYFLGYQDRGAVVTPEHATKVVPGSNGVFFPMIVHNGQVVGTWKRAVKKARVEIDLSLFEANPTLETHAMRAAQAYAAFLGVPVG